MVRNRDNDALDEVAVGDEEVDDDGILSNTFAEVIIEEPMPQGSSLKDACS